MDVIDQSDEHSQPLIDAALKAAHLKVLADNVPSIAGECEGCGFHSARLVLCTHPKDGNIWACARCRDMNKLPNART